MFRALLRSPHLYRPLSVINGNAFSTSAQMNRIENVLIVGSGLMGSVSKSAKIYLKSVFEEICFTKFLSNCFLKGIAQSCATSAKFNSITLQDVSEEQLGKAKNRIAQSLTKLKEQKRVNVDNVDAAVARITFSQEIKPVSEENLVIIEAIPELLEPKQRLFKELCERFRSNKTVIYVTNTSSLPCYEIGKYVDCKERYGGLHFFNPVPLMKLVEIVRVLEGTNDNTYNNLVQFVKDIDKVGVSCKDTPGFIVNRLLVPYMQEAVRMLERGDATARDIDTAMKLGAGYPMGPFELMDYVGLDTNKFIVDAWGARGDPNLTIHRSKLIEAMVAKGNLGKKTGKGFYDYTSTKK